MYIRFFTVTKKIHLTPKNSFGCSKFTRMAETFEAHFVQERKKSKLADWATYHHPLNRMVVQYHHQ